MTIQEEARSNPLLTEERIIAARETLTAAFHTTYGGPDPFPCAVGAKDDEDGFFIEAKRNLGAMQHWLRGEDGLDRLMEVESGT